MGRLFAKFLPFRHISSLLDTRSPSETATAFPVLLPRSERRPSSGGVMFPGLATSSLPLYRGKWQTCWRLHWHEWGRRDHREANSIAITFFVFNVFSHAPILHP